MVSCGCQNRGCKSFQHCESNFSNDFGNGPGIDSNLQWEIADIIPPVPRQPGIESLFDSRAIGHVAKLPGRNVCVMVTSTDACEQLEWQSVTVLGKSSFFKEYDTLDSRYYLDVFGVGVVVERLGILKSLHEKKCGLPLDTFREANSSKGVAMST